MIKYLILSIIFFSCFLRADNTPRVSCSSKEDCSELGLGLSQVAILLSGLMGPHYLLNRMDLERNMSFVQIGASKEIKKFEIDMASALIRNEPHLLVTKIDLQSFSITNQNSLVKFLFGIGYGYNFKINELFLFKTQMLLDFIGYDNKTTIDNGLEFNTLLQYYYNDRIKPIFGIRLLSHPKVDYDLSFGVNLKAYNFAIHRQSESQTNSQYTYLSLALQFL
jgi:hypothetical protein